MVHTNAIAYGFLANGFLGMLHWAIPRLTLQPVLEQPLVVVHLRRLAGRRLATAVGILLGEAQGV